MKTSLVAAAFLSAVALTSHRPSTALGYGHGESPELAHYVSSPQDVFVSVLPNGTLPSRDLARYALPGDTSLVFTREAPRLAPGVKRTWVRTKHQPGRLLAVVEGHASLDTPSLLQKAGARVVFFQGNRTKNPSAGLWVVDVDTRGLSALAAEPRLFIEPVPAQETKRPPAVPRLSKPAGVTPAVPAGVATALSNLPVLEPESARLLATIRDLSGEDDVIVDGKETRIVDRGNDAPRALAQSYMVDKFRALGLEADTQCYTQGRYQGCNVVATLWGADRNEFVVFSAHLDSVRNKGADDDGSGSAALLEVARLYAGLSPRKSIRFLAFDQEELGLIGSKAYASGLTAGSGDGKIAGVFQLDMIGYDNDGDSAIHAMDCNRAESRPLTRALSETNARIGTSLKIVSACTNRSDHASFWNKGIPATLVSENFFGGEGTRDDSNRCYHQACDTVALLNVPYMNRIVKLVANAGWSFQEGHF
jgi:hypothetical protein